MGGWESLLDKKIRQAIEDGEFDDLSGKGEPIDLTENPFEDPDWRMAHRLLRNAGFAPAWIEERKDIESEIAAARTTLARVWLVLQNAQQPGDKRSAAQRWQNALADFGNKSAELNRRIDTWNLKAPAVSLHRQRIDPGREIERLKG